MSGFPRMEVIWLRTVLTDAPRARAITLARRRRGGWPGPPAPAFVSGRDAGTVFVCVVAPADFSKDAT